jgi:aminoglycoside phosphotransferase (APT) family kinase protein
MLFEQNADQNSKVTVGKIRFLGSGLYRGVFSGWVEVEPDPQGLTDVYVVMLPNYNTAEDYVERIRCESKVLEALDRLSFSIRVPRVIGLVEYEDTTILVESFVEGYKLDYKSTRNGVLPWEVLGRLAATIHSVDLSTIEGLTRGHQTLEEYARANLAVFEEFDEPLVNAAYDWVQDHLPPSTPTVLIHGDLLGQNIRIMPEQNPGVIDWNCCQKGDPAYELAIITRGVKRPFSKSDGLKKLVEAYHQAGGVELDISRVYFYEICMAAEWYRRATEGQTVYGPPQQAHNFLEKILKRAEQSD